MKILVIGGGGREHALAWKIGQSPLTTELFVAPGNAGTARIARNVPIPAEDGDSLVQFVKKSGIELVVVGPEGPLASGIADRFNRAGVPVFGPSRAAAEIEFSKVFAKNLMARYGIPCARSVAFGDFALAEAHLNNLVPPVVVKADGLAAGKGVIIAATLKDAGAALRDIMVKKVFGDAGRQVIIEEYLTGREVSALAFTDGKTIIPMVPACDYKPVFDCNRGPNTGGMGAFSPPPFYTPEIAATVMQTIMAPTVAAMNKEGRPYQGVLYCGLMLTENGPRVLEYNCRFGDPETQVILPRLASDLVTIMLAVINGTLDQATVKWSPDSCVGAVMASPGYPGNYGQGYAINGLDDAGGDTLIFHAGTRPGQNPGEVITAGGRVLAVVATGDSIALARRRVYNRLSGISFTGAHYRHDIGLIND